MIVCMLNSLNESVRVLTLVNKENKTSIIGENWNEINVYLNVNMKEENVKMQLLRRQYKKYTPECQLLLELIEIREGNMHLSGFTKDDISEMLNDICTL